jgi:hypothetical protein
VPGPPSGLNASHAPRCSECEHLQEFLDEALKEIFSASDPAAIPAGAPPRDRPPKFPRRPRDQTMTAEHNNDYEDPPDPALLKTSMKLDFAGAALVIIDP